MLRLHTTNRKMDTVFVAALFVLFAMTACLLVLIGARQYHATAKAMNTNYEIRTASSYLTEKIHQNDCDAGIAIVDFAGGNALALTDDTDRSYTTYIYYYDGYLRELFVGENAVYTPDSGQTIIPCKGFDLTLVRSGLILASVKDTSGTKHKIYLNIHVTSGRDAS